MSFLIQTIFENKKVGAQRTNTKSAKIQRTLWKRAKGAINSSRQDIADNQRSGCADCPTRCLRNTFCR